MQRSLAALLRFVNLTELEGAYTLKEVKISKLEAVIVRRQELT